MGRQLFSASEGGHIEEAKRLLREGAPTNWKDSYGHIALHVAIGFSNENKECVNLLLASKTNVNEQNCYGDTALHKACAKGCLECVKIIVENELCNLG